MCGIAGIIHRNKSSDIGSEMTSMLQSLKHRGPDSTGFAIYGMPQEDEFVLRFKVAEQEDAAKGYNIHQEIRDRRPKSTAASPNSGSRSSRPSMPRSTPIATASSMAATCARWPTTSRT